MIIPLLALLVVSGVKPAQAGVIFNVSAIFADNNSTPLRGTVSVDAGTGAIDGFNFNIPTMTTGSTTLPGALFTPQTATPSFSGFGPGSFITFQLFGAPPQGEELFLLVPGTCSLAGCPLLQVLNFQGTNFHTGYQSGVQANPFFEIAGDGTITPAAVPEPSSLVPLSISLVAVIGAALRRKKLFRLA